MRDPRLEKLADVLVRYSTRVKRGDLVCVAGPPAALPLVEAIFESVLRAGGHPYWMARHEALDELLLARGDDDQVSYVSPIDEHRVGRVDVHLAVWAETNTRAMGRADPARQARRDASQRPLMTRFLERAGAGELRWCGTLFPTAAFAQDAERSLREYEEFVYRAGLLHTPDPVAAWTAVRDRQERLRDDLQSRRELRFHVPPHAGHDGTDLRVNVDPSRSRWINCAGTENFPDGEVFCGPQGADGHVNFTFPAVESGREVQGVRLEFRGGRVVGATATKNEDFLIRMLDQDAGARTMGEIAIGTNEGITEHTRNTLFDEKIGGTFHAAVGAGYPESGSTNESGLHWDMVCDLRRDGARGLPGGTIAADGVVFHRDGAILIPGW